MEGARQFDQLTLRAAQVKRSDEEHDAAALCSFFRWIERS
jgi:hypothetical protein